VKQKRVKIRKLLKKKNKLPKLDILSIKKICFYL